MKIANITCVYPPYRGGIGTAAKEFADLMREAGHEITTFFPDHGKNYQKGEDKNTVKLKTFLRYGNAAFLPQFFWLLKDFEIVYLNYPFFGTQEILWLALKIVYPRKKFIIRYHMDIAGKGVIFKIFSLPLKIIFKSFFKRSNLIITASLDYVRHGDLAGIYQKNPEKFIEIPYGVDIEKFQPAVFVIPTDSALREERGNGGIPFVSKESGVCERKGSLDSVRLGRTSLGMTKKNKDIFNLLFVGGLDRAHYFKGVDVLLKAVSKINEKEKKSFLGGGVRSARGGRDGECDVDWRLNIIGSGNLEEEYKNKAIKLGIADKVSFLNSVGAEELPVRYRENDCLILPSINKGEAFGIVLIEAMASGLPVIASDLPGVRGVFTPETGLKVRPGDEIDLAEKIKYLMDDPVKLAQMKLAARKLAKEKYAREKIKSDYIDALINLNK